MKKEELRTKKLSEKDAAASPDSENQAETFESLASLPQEKASRLVEFLRYSQLEEAQSVYDEISGTYHVQVWTHHFEKAQNLYDVFSENELDEAENPVDITSAGNIYENSTEKYKDYFSSAVTFLICGVAGLIVLLLNDFGVLHFLSSEGASFILMNVVLGGLFIAFIVIGIMSFKHSKKAKKQAEEELSSSQELLGWLKENITAEKIESSYNTDIPDEMKYFNRSEYIKKVLLEQFPDSKSEIVESVTDYYIETLFHS